MLINLKDILGIAEKKGHALGSFNVYSYETVKGVVNAAKEAKRPAIISFGAAYLKNISLETMYNIVVSETTGDDIFCLHLDHCEDIDIIKKAVDIGFTSVMYDGSSLCFEENIKNTKKIVDMAHQKDVSVEAELGSIALGDFSNETEIDHGQMYTDPKLAKEFAGITGIDALAVSIGTVHGMYKGNPKIRIDILEKIKENVNIPLVLHGGSGTPEDILDKCIKNGIRKINVNTEISMNAVSSILDVLKAQPKTHLSRLSLIEIEKVSEVVYKYIKLFEA